MPPVLSPSPASWCSRPPAEEGSSEAQKKLLADGTYGSGEWGCAFKLLRLSLGGCGTHASVCLAYECLLSEASPLGKVPHDWTLLNQSVCLVVCRKSWWYHGSKAGWYPRASIVTNGGLKGRSENIMQIKYRDRRKDHNLNLQNVIALSK